MKQELIAKLHQNFEKVVCKDQDVEFWYARDLQKLLGYEKWSNFLKVVEKAKMTCLSSKQAVTDQFADVGKLIPMANGAQRETRPEDLPQAEDIKKIERKLISEDKKLSFTNRKASTETL